MNQGAMPAYPAKILSIMDRAANLYWAEHFRGDAEDMENAKAFVERSLRENHAMALECRHLRQVNHRLVELLSAIHMRCAPPDVKMPDGRTMRFVPPDPEFYWRELSAKVNNVMDEMRAITEAADRELLAALSDQPTRQEGAT